MNITIINNKKNWGKLSYDSTSFTNILIGYSIALYLIDFPIFFGITTSRLGFILMIFGLVSLIKHHKYKIIFSKIKKILFYSLFIVLISVFFSTFHHISSLKPFITSFFTFLSFIILLLFIENEKKFNIIVEKASHLSFVFILFLVSLSFYKFGLFAYDSLTMRNQVNEWGPGLSRIVNGLTFANVLIISHCYTNKVRKKGLLLTFSSIFSFWFVFSTHSRQGLFLVIILIFTSVIMLYPSFKYKKIFLIFSFSFLFFILFEIFNSDAFQQRIVERTLGQVERDEGSTAVRVYYYQMGFKLFKENPFYGIGPDNFSNRVGGDAHSGYLLELTEVGVLSTFSFIILIYAFYFKWKLLKNSTNYLPIICLLLVIFLAPIFNSIYRSPMFWDVLLIVFNLNSSNNNYSVKS